MNINATKIFKYRSYTPIPFLILMLIFENASVTSLVIGFVIALTGELIRLWGVSWAGSETRTTGGVGGSFLVISGPFAHVRNPLYVGNILLYFGIGIMSMSLFPYLQIVALLFFVFQYFVIVKEEEGYLIKTFGEDYKKYFNNVPRFLWRFSSYKDESIPQPEFILSKGLKSETRTLQAFGFVALLIVIKWYLRSNNIL
ncbi:MAG TPA: isoprenylcysteine carboxylmethyltransferase family protein [Ignavibacteriaceae bacterium]|nr:isoprenylcysteine carboxylmethyltransferase family protein [Ignavibacteriaceae bacterium]